MRKPLILLVILFSFFSCKNENKTETAQIDGHPAWIMQGNIYEVNVRQYTPEGTFAAFAKHLDRLKEMGVQTLWFMPVNPISKVERKGTLGSYYAVSDYTAINPEYGTMDDWKALVKQAHEKGFKVMIDWVPNHTGADHYWLEKHPDFYVHDSTGKPVSQFDWTDTRKLNFNNAELRDTMINQMKFWVTQTGIDGFRCDYAVGPSRDFWRTCNKELKATKSDIFLLAEADSAWLYDVGFDATYAWPEFNMMKLIAAGKRSASAMDSVVAFTDSTLPKNGIRLFFTSNHDENSWNKADFQTMPGASHAPFAVLTQTMKRSMPLVYSGQEEPVLRSIQFFEKDPMGFAKYERAPFYKKLLELHSSTAALSPDASFTRLHTNVDDKIYAYAREKDGKKVVVLLNFSNAVQTFTITNDALVTGDPTDVFSGARISIKTGNQFMLDPWGYRVYRY
ncbi:MAG: alpha-amylase family glycosyl hydrolase [Sediminibacterium sp.]